MCVGQTHSQANAGDACSGCEQMGTGQHRPTQASSRPAAEQGLPQEQARAGQAQSKAPSQTLHPHETAEDGELINGLTRWAETPLPLADQQSEQAVVAFACAAWRWTRDTHPTLGYVHAAAITAAALLVQCLHRWWTTADGDLDEVINVTRQLLYIIRDIRYELASPTPAEAALQTRKPPPNRKARK